MSISVIIPTRNEKHNLPRLLKSLIQRQPLKEIILVDNHSTDGTQRVIRSFSKKHAKRTPIILIIKGPERSAQKNSGAEKARGTHLLFLDADMEATSGLLKELEKHIEKDAQAVIIPEQPLGSGFWGKATALERSLYQNTPLLEAPRLIEAKVLRNIGGYDPKLIAGEDWDLYQRLKALKLRVVRSRNKLIHHEAKGLIPNLSRKWYYTSHIIRYAEKHPARFAEQSKLTTRLGMYWQARRQLIKNPIHTLAFLFMKAVIYVRWKLVNP